MAQNPEGFFQYISPLPDAKLVSRETNIIIRPGETLGVNNITSLATFTITGSISGRHEYKAILSDDQKTIILRPLIPFEAGEIVTVGRFEGLEQAIGRQVRDMSFNFSISPKPPDQYDEMPDQEEFYNCCGADNLSASDIISDEELTLDDDPSLPSDLVLPTIHLLNNPANGYVFTGKTGSFGQAAYLLIQDNSGYPIYYRRFPRNINIFNEQPDGYLAYYQLHVRAIFVIDTNYVEADTFRTGNGYNTNAHEFQMIDNGHVLLLAYDSQIIDMSEIVPGGCSNAVITGLIIQELDSLENVVFQWRSWDHFQITDATYMNFLACNIDYVHGNAIELDHDGNLLISSRHMDEITKIDRQTGEIIWRLGGNNNQFTFVGDTVGFCRQHDIRRIPNGHITLFDNGNFHTPQFSRAVEYELDEENMKCTLVWEYHYNPDIFGDCCGNVQRLPDGNTMIGWGGPNYPSLTEVNSDNEKVFEMSLDGAPSSWTYRAFRIPWQGRALWPHLMAERVDPGAHLIFHKFGDTDVAKYYIYYGGEQNPTMLKDSTSNNYYDIDSLVQYPTYYCRVTAVDNQGVESPFSNEVELAGEQRFYIPGDINGDREVEPTDVTYGVRYFLQLGPAPPDTIWNDSTHTWLYCAADANGDCGFIGSDITYLVGYFRHMIDRILYCAQTPPFEE